MQPCVTDIFYGNSPLHIVGPYNCKVEEVFRNDVDISVVGEVDKNLGVPAPDRLFLQPSSPLGSYLPPAHMELNMGNTQA